MARREHTDESRRQHAEAQRRWRETHAGEFERLSLTVALGTRDKLREKAAKRGLSVSRLIEWFANR